MVTRHLHVLAIVPGEETGWCRLTVPRYSMFADEPSEIWERDYGLFRGCDAANAIAIARLAVQIQSLDYKTGPAIVIETNEEEVLAVDAMMGLLRYEKRIGDATIHYQSRRRASKVTDDVLHQVHMFTGHDMTNNAHRHAITTLRLARQKRSYAHDLWPYPPSGVA